MDLGYYLQPMVRCPLCKCHLSLEKEWDYPPPKGEGIVTKYLCPKEECDVDEIQVFTRV